MRSLTITAGLTCLALGACSSILGLDSFEDTSTSSNGGNAGLGGAAGGGAGVSGGQAGVGGDSGPPIVCQKDDVEYDVLTQNFPNLFSLENGRSLFVATDPTSAESSAHVILWGSFQVDAGSVQSLLRITSVSDKQKGVVNDSVHADNLRVFGAYADATTLHVFARSQNAFKRLDFQLENALVTNAPPTTQDLFTCPSAMQIEGAAATWAQAAPGFAVTCKDPSGTQLYIWNGTSADLVASGPADDPSLKVRGYVFAEGIHLISTENAIFRYGSNPVELAKVHQIAFADGVTMSFTAMPYSPVGSPTPTGAILLLAHLKPNNDIKAYLGSVETKDYSLLDGTTAPPGFQSVLPDSSFAAGIESAGISPNAIDLAGPSVTKDGNGNSTLYFWKIDRQGVPLLLHYPVTSGKIPVAAAVPFGIRELVVWVREDPFAVRAQHLFCKPEAS